MPLIMLDGVDGAGKSTFALDLKDAWNGPAQIIHKTQFTGSPVDEYELSLKKYVPGAGNLLILDRWFLSEIIYGRIMRGSSKLATKLDAFHIMKVLNSRGSANVVMTAPQEVLAYRLDQRGEDYLPPSKIHEVNKAFVGWAKEYDWTVVRSTLTGLPDNAVESILALAASKDRQAALVSPPPSYVGPLKPSHLLVMEDVAKMHFAGQPTWHSHSQKLTHPMSVRGINTGQIFLSELTRHNWTMLGSPPILAQNDYVAELVHRLGWELVDVY